MPSTNFHSQHMACLRSSGILMSFEDSNLNEKIVIEILKRFGIETVFLGMQYEKVTRSWRQDIYFNKMTNFTTKDDVINTFINDQVLLATFDESIKDFTFKSVNRNHQASAICEYSKIFILLLQKRLKLL